MPRDARSGGPTDAERFRHMLDAAVDVRAYIRGRSRSDLEADSMFRRAVLHALQQIGEAAARVTDAGRSRAPTVPWGQIVATRNILVHVYWGVDVDLVWRMCVEDVPVLIEAIERVLASASGD